MIDEKDRQDEEEEDLEPRHSEIMPVVNWIDPDWPGPGGDPKCDIDEAEWIFMRLHDLVDAGKGGVDYAQILRRRYREITGKNAGV